LWTNYLGLVNTITMTTLQPPVTLKLGLTTLSRNLQGKMRPNSARYKVVCIDSQWNIPSSYT